MTNLKEKQEKWLLNLREGDENYLAVARGEKGWYLLSHRTAEPVAALMIMIDDGNGLRPEYYYSFAQSDVNPLDTTIVIKDEKKMILSDKNGCYAFGIKDIKSPAKAIFVYLRTAKLHTFIFAHQEACSVNMLLDLVREEKDATARCMESLVPTSMTMVKSEVVNNE